jgi:hypothetical protein
MKQSQKERRLQHDQRQQPTQPVKPAGPQAPSPDYVMSEGADAQPVYCAPAAPDSR